MSFSLSSPLSCTTFPPGPPLTAQAAVRWLPPSPPNGVIRGYSVSVRQGDIVVASVVVTDTVAVFESLHAFSDYAVSCVAFTAVGPGPAATLNMSTLSAAPDDSPQDIIAAVFKCVHDVVSAYHISLSTLMLIKSVRPRPISLGLRQTSLLVLWRTSLSTTIARTAF